ncbi:hypothetical protein MJL79_32090, partial [Salmonella enterica subsp. enterica serovar Montevideo]|nr:hypothetical protein [Salmonella enterica subsp. enterica serovar Montevideo]
AARMREAGETGAIVTLLCDSGDRYLDTYYHPAWVSDHIGDLTKSEGDCMDKLLERFLHYVSLDTQSKSGVRQVPSTEGQWKLL